jgi:hypothetical protein
VKLGDFVSGRSINRMAVPCASLPAGIVASISDRRRRSETAATTEYANSYGALNSSSTPGEEILSVAVENSFQQESRVLFRQVTRFHFVGQNVGRDLPRHFTVRISALDV